MEAMHVRFGSLLEWILAAACIAALLATGSFVGREFRTVSAVTPVIAHEAPAPDPPAAVPSRAVSVPVWLMPDGTEVHVGDGVSQVAARLGPLEVGIPSVERAPTGPRVTRFYEEGATRFVVVFEPFAGDGEVRVAGIYVR